jgi:hypothetical protein
LVELVGLCVGNGVVLVVGRLPPYPVLQIPLLSLRGGEGEGGCELGVGQRTMVPPLPIPTH